MTVLGIASSAKGMAVAPRSKGVIAASDIKFLYRRICDCTTFRPVPDDVIRQDVDHSG